MTQPLPRDHPVSRRRALALGAVAIVALNTARRDAEPVPPQRRGPATSPDLEDAARRGALCTAKDLPGVGLLGEYFMLDACRGTPALARIDPVVDFDASFDWPAGQVPAGPRSVRWSGWLRAPMDGRYRFHLDAPDGVVLVARQSMRDPGAGIELHAGRYYPIEARLERVAASGARVRLEWTAPHGARYVIPRALLQPPSGEPRRA
jgi:hypothetical protein